MFDLHEWTKQPYETPIQKHLMIETPNYWFGEGIGNALKLCEVVVQGKATVSYHISGKHYAAVKEIEYGIARYKNSTFTVIAPFPGITENWRYLGSLPSPMKEQ